MKFLIQEFILEAAVISLEDDTDLKLQNFIFEVAIVLTVPIKSPLEIADNLVFSQIKTHLKYIEKLIIQGTISNQTYEQIAASSNYSKRQLKELASNLWEILSEALGEKVNKTNFNNIIQQQVNYSQIDIHRSLRQGQCFIENLRNGVQLEMVSIPQGSFLMGSPENEPERYDDESPQHQVTVSAFFMGKYPITQAQWRAVAALPHINRHIEPNPSEFKGDNRPVEKVSWYDALEFCDRLAAYTKRQYRLSSEAEWEYACRAGTTSPFYFGEKITSDLANYDANYDTNESYGAGIQGIYREETTVVGSLGVANAFGLYDMHGNVWEWCLDDWHSNYESAPTDGSAWFNNNDNPYQKQVLGVLRGGSWLDLPVDCRCACRVGNIRNGLYNNFGFRIVCGVGETA